MKLQTCKVIDLYVSQWQKQRINGLKPNFFVRYWLIDLYNLIVYVSKFI